VNRADPLLRRAFGAWRRWPLWALAVALASAVWMLATVTAPLATDAAADRAFVAEVEHADTSRPGGGLDAVATTTRLVDADVADVVGGQLDGMQGYREPRMSVSQLGPYTGVLAPTPYAEANGRSVAAMVFASDGLVESLEIVDGRPIAPQDEGGRPEVLVPDAVAEGLGVGPDDAITLVLRYPSGAGADQPLPVRATVAGVYLTSGGEPVVAEGSPGFRLPRKPFDAEEPVELLITDPATAMAIIDAMSDATTVVWDVPFEGPTELEFGRLAARAILDAQVEFRGGNSLAARQLDDVEASEVLLRSSVGSFVDRAQRAADELAPVLAALAVTGRIVGAAVLVLATVLLARARRREVVLATSIGTSPLRIAAISTAELMAPLVLGVGAAYAIVRWTPAVVAGGGAIDSATLDDALSTLVRWMPAPFVAVALTALATAWLADPVTTVRTRRVLGVLSPGVIVTVAALAALVQLTTQRGSALDSGSSLLFPALATLAVAIGAARLAAVIVGRSGRWRTRDRPRSMWRWLAARSLRSSLVELASVFVIVTTGVGMFVYTTSVASAGEDTISDKAAAMGGATTTALVPAGAQIPLDPDGFPAALPETTVGWRASSILADSYRTDILVVDPETFADAVDWRDTFAERSLDDLLADIGDSDAGVVDVIVAGNYNDEFDDEGEFSFRQTVTPVPYRIVGRIDAGPWQRLRAPLMIVAAEPLAPLLGDEEGIVPGPATSEGLERGFTTFVWSRLDAAALTSLVPTDLEFDANLMNVPTAEREPPFVAFSLSLPYLRLVGIGLLALGVVATLVLGSRRSESLAVDLSITRQMGISGRTMLASGVASAVSVTSLASLFGVATAVALTDFMTGRLDPAAEFPPAFGGSVEWRSVALSVCLVVTAAAAGALVEHRAARARPTAEVLRGAE
jgi:hypothetical protein